VTAEAPRAVRLFFDDPIRAEGGIKAIRNGGSSILGGKARVVDQRTLVIPLKSGLGDGDYTVLWRAVSDDGHPIAGVLAFGVGAGRGPPEAALSVERRRETLQILERWLFFVGILTAGGAATFALASRQHAPPSPHLFVFSFLLVIAGGAPLAAEASVATRFGETVTAATVVAATGAALGVAAIRFRRLAPWTWMAALLLLLAPSFSGHALDAGRPRAELFVDIAHVAASSIWLGGLVALAAQLHRGPVATVVVRRFSILALGSVLVLAATGVVRAFAELTSVEHLWTTSYGRLLVVKTILLAAVVAIAWMSRYRVLPALARSASRLRRNVVAEVALLLAVVVAVAALTETAPDRDRAAIAIAAAAAGDEAEAEDTAVLEQSADGLLLEATPARATVVRGRYAVWETFGSDEGAVATLEQRDLRSGATTVLARPIAPQYGLAATARETVYATAAVPPQLVVVRRGETRREAVSRRLLAPFAWRGDRIAWAEQRGERQRVIVRSLETGKERVAAEVPMCERGRCYRVDAVTLASDGVVFDRGAIGPQPSFVVRRHFTGPRPEKLELPKDPQPDLVPSSEGAVFYALGRGWRRWDFAQENPTSVPVVDEAGREQLLLRERNHWFVLRHDGCDDVVVELIGRRASTVGSPAKVRALSGAGKAFCARFISLTWNEGRAVTTWSVAPAAAHSHAEPTGVILFGRPIR
jgi:copper transport protein